MGAVTSRLQQISTIAIHFEKYKKPVSPEKKSCLKSQLKTIKNALNKTYLQPRQGSLNANRSPKRIINRMFEVLILIEPSTS